jgi:hypothetical protein
VDENERRILRPDPTHWDFVAEEEALASTAPGGLNCLGIARMATGALANALWQAPEPAPSDPPSSDFYRQVALLQLGALAVRSANALVVLIAHRYEAEAHGLKRRVSEAYSRAQIVTEDATGDQARRWIEHRDEGNPPGIAQRLGMRGPWDYRANSATRTRCSISAAD